MKKIKTKVLGVIRYWIEKHFYDFSDGGELLKSVTNFIAFLRTQKSEKWADTSLTQIESLLRMRFDELNKERAWTTLLKQKLSEVGTTHKKAFSVFDLPIEELASHWAMLDFADFKKVMPTELLKKNWESERAKELAPNLLLITHRGETVLAATRKRL